jgi:hypothetical protein
MGKYLEWSQQFRSQIDTVISDAKDVPKSINEMSLLVRPWQSGTSDSPVYHAVDEVRSENKEPYKCCQAHTHSGEANWNPAAAPALWTQYHGTSYATARPFLHPTGAHDIYLYDEYMIFTDSKVYRCISANGTAYSPTEYAAAWEEATA